MKKLLIIPLIATVVILAAVAAVALATRENGERAGKPASANDTGTGSQTVTVTLVSDKASYVIGEKATFTSTIHNGTSSVKTYNFTSTCTFGTLYIDDTATQRSLLCGQALTDVVLQPGESKQYTYKFDLVNSLSELTGDPLPAGTLDYDGALALPDGSHSAYLEWQGLKSATTSFSTGK